MDERAFAEAADRNRVHAPRATSDRLAQIEANVEAAASRIAAVKAARAQGAEGPEGEIMDNWVATLKAIRDGFVSARNRIVGADPMALTSTDREAAVAAHRGVLLVGEAIIDELAERMETRPDATTARVRWFGAMARQVGELKHPLAPDKTAADALAARVAQAWPTRPESPALTHSLR